MSPFGFETPCEEVVKACGDRVKGRTFLITGTSAKGLGANAAVALSREAPAHILLVSRNQAKVNPVIAEIAATSPGVQVTFVPCELSDFASVRRAAAAILANAAVPRIDVVLNNAGVMAIKDFTLDPQGHELTLSSNHLGHFLLTNLLLPKILAAGPGARIVNVTSIGHRVGPFRFADPNFSDGVAYDCWSAYGQSKTANILFTVELARRLGPRGIASFAVHPGGILGTNLASHLTMDEFGCIEEISRRNNGRVTFTMDHAFKTISQGTAPLLAACLDPALEAHNGSFVKDCQVGQALEYATDPENAKKLWTLSEQLVGQVFDV
ncbi:Short-chain dehydrogenase TIC 32 [Apiospora marii]|uniref:Short-chain dehydrogenase TIC 32 n=1 Tax=Apiospora marii TaxID=335849 RepID=A0ABR1R2C2_9PEZI